ncbi:hypothetical protein FHX81_5407 [Saccharothrix saharensis]|uniref:Excreted virulence factor EspC (Type VII ESX diderm) n=1 Tax=Saccharothrix saharensis TaxID=571190 RepID=A0A543JJP1_9PSEU|nr:hypothetical protein [Saccharothrix saharensis]TQM82994.1 hypothetical protein FHX81_5407 [Saccharothrix saharensis]
MDAIVAGISGMGTAVADFGAAVGAGFVVSAKGGAALIEAIDRIQAQSERAIQTADRLAQEPPLGTTPAARVYKPFLATIASDPDQGFVPALRRFTTDLALLRDQVVQAMDLYRTTDQGAEHGVTDAGGPILSA